MSTSNEAAQAAATRLAAAMGVTDMNVAEIARMLELKYILWPMFQVSVVFLILAWFAVSLRVYARAVVLKSVFGWDDWLMVVTLIVFSTCCACLIAIEQIEMSHAASQALENGLAYQLPLMNRIYHLILSFMSLYIVTTIVLKLSLAIFFLRVIPHGWQRKVLYIATGVYTTYGVIFTFIVVLQCGNPRHFFIQKARGKCIADSVLQPLYYIAGGMNALTDWTFSILPMTVIWNAAIPRSTKISAACLLALGSLGSVSSLVRLVYIPGIEASPTFLEHAVNIASWSIVEPGLGIIAASLATLRPLVRHCRPDRRKTILPTAHRNKTITYTPGTYCSRMSFEDKVAPYGEMKMGYLTTIIGNARQEMTELQDVALEGHKKKHSSMEELSVQPKTTCSMTAISRVDSAKSLVRKEQCRVSQPSSPTNNIFAQHGRVVMSMDVKVEKELYMSRLRLGSPDR